MGQSLDKLTIKGFKSIKSLENFKLKNLNIMIGGNGAGKSNFIEVFRMLCAMAEGESAFDKFTQMGGGADDFLHNGPKATPVIEIDLNFEEFYFSRRLFPTVSEKFVIEKEGIFGKNKFATGIYDTHLQSEIGKSLRNQVNELVSNIIVYHFHDTSSTAPMRRSEITADNIKLRSDASNIAPFLLQLRKDEPKHYNAVVEAVRLVTPFFDDFILEPERKGEKEKVNLSWRQKGSDYPMQPYHFSDGTIRFICLATALLQPAPPSAIIIDEPELGLHPYAIEILSELIKAASTKTQVIISTQSPHLIDKFNPEDIIVVNREDGASTFDRLNEKELAEWLKDYSLGELWRKNVIAGGPVNE
ncbi:MAG: recombinase RecF [Planctomycetes bacterium GWF2_41_51]|nr:MAG: recombinase RecF [Planctomycetes bacterium GWF2_41_51]HBG27467.1 recombinase RecF [Phycisphaerales bacterium]